MPPNLFIWFQRYAFLFLLCLSFANAHGNVIGLSVGSVYSDNNKDGYTLRRVTTNRGVSFLDNNDIVCNTDGQISIIDAPIDKDNNAPSKPAPASASVKAGDTIKYQWTNWLEFVEKFSHHGPIITYLGRCEQDDCTNFDPAGKSIWFKIDEGGFEKMDTLPDGRTYPRFGGDSMGFNGNSWTVTVPKGLTAGNYLMRHEVVALHLAGNLNGAQFFPSCAQLSVSSDDTMEPDIDLVAFPGAYKADDPGILIKLNDIDANFKYIVPGPPVATYTRKANAEAPVNTSKSAATSKSSADLASTSISKSATSDSSPSSTPIPLQPPAAGNLANAQPPDPVSDIRMARSSGGEVKLLSSSGLSQFTGLSLWLAPSVFMGFWLFFSV